MSDLLNAISTDQIRTAALIETMTPEQAAAKLRQCLILNRCGGSLPPTRVQLLPGYLGLPLDQETSAKRLTQLGSFFLLPKDWIRKLEVPRGRLSNWTVANCQKSIFGNLIPMGRWCTPGYQRPDFYDPTVNYGIHATFREVFDQAQLLLAATVEELINEYDHVVNQLKTECFALAKDTYRHMLPRFRKDPDAYPQFPPVTTSDGEKWPSDPISGEPITEEIFAERYWNIIHPQIPTPETIRESTKLYYDIQAVPTQAYEPLLVEGSSDFDADLKAAQEDRLNQFNAALQDVMTQIWDHVVSAAGSLVESLDRTNGKLHGRMSGTIKGLIAYVRSVNIVDDPFLTQLADELSQTVNANGKCDTSTLHHVLSAGLMNAHRCLRELKGESIERDMVPTTFDLDAMEGDILVDRE